MQISFETEELRDYHRIPAKALIRYGPTAAKGLAMRFADLRALQNASELVAFGAEECAFDGLHALKVPVAKDCSLVLVANHPKKKELALNWAGVTRVKVVTIGRHDEQG
ncbi:hypothetical protein WME95_37140 [Sorangium sp. So ce327]|uniref:hypothetical protein n=1 Tax=Sorangium sp. So ce327 TaxID=3133301 RepID=UPI003F60A747